MSDHRPVVSTPPRIHLEPKNPTHHRLGNNELFLPLQETRRL